MNRILILTAGYGEGHNAAARGIRAGLARIAPSVQVEVHDLFAETYVRLHAMARWGYLTLINRWPRAWGTVYRWLDRKTDFEAEFRKPFFLPVKEKFAALLARFQPDTIVSVFPPFPYLLEQIAPRKTCRSIVVITDSITVNAIWYRSNSDYFLVPNEQSAAVVREGGVSPDKIKVFGFPVNPAFADVSPNRQTPARKEEARVLYMISGGTRQAPELVKHLLHLGVKLTVTVGHNKKLARRIGNAASGQPIEIIGWTDQLPRLLGANHLLIGKAGGATIQETIAAGCPVIINHVVSGQEEGNARLIVQTGSGMIAVEPSEVEGAVEHTFANGAWQWRDWANNIAQLSRPRASLDIAEFLIGL